MLVLTLLLGTRSCVPLDGKDEPLHSKTLSGEKCTKHAWLAGCILVLRSWEGDIRFPDLEVE